MGELLTEADRRTREVTWDVGAYDAPALMSAWPPFATAVETVMPQKRRFVLHQDRKDIAAGRICNATRVRSYVTLSGVRVTVPG